MRQKRKFRRARITQRLTERLILEWCDDHHEYYGKWPKRNSGRIRVAPEMWTAIDAALTRGSRGLPGGSSLPQLLARRRGVRHEKMLPRLTERQILEWCDDHHDYHGKWPKRLSGRVRVAPETWSGINAALINGGRGLPGGTSLAQLLARRRGVRNHKDAPRLTERLILEWCDDHHEYHGKWPKQNSGRIRVAPEAWTAIDCALSRGIRGLPGGSSLAQLLERRRGVRNEKRPPRLTERQILEWCDDHHDYHGKWPNRNSGRVRVAPETWTAVEVALTHGRRGLPGGSSLAQLLERRRGVRNVRALPRLTTEKIREWTREWFRLRGRWPTRDCGVIPKSGGETWAAVATALSRGSRGLPGGSTLTRFLEVEFGVPAKPPPLTVNQILAWADAHRISTGRWPTRRSGMVPGSSNERWINIESALNKGKRGLPSGSSLARLLARYRGTRIMRELPQLTPGKIMRWARQYTAATGRRPTKLSGSVTDRGKETGETWSGIDAALKFGGRGLAGGDSLFRLLSRNGLAGNSPKSTLVSDGR